MSRNKKNSQHPRKSDSSAVHKKDEYHPLITVGIITWNRLIYLPMAIQSALTQEFDDFEILIADDGSTDDTAGLVAKFQSPKIRFLPLEHRGAPPTRNSLIAEAKGDFILWLDSDDVLLPDALTKYSKAIKSHPDVDVHYGDWVVGDQDLKPKGTQTYPDWYAQPEKLIPAMLWKSSIPHGGTLIRRSILNKIDGYDINFPSGHDDQMWSRAAEFATFRHVGGVVYIRREHGGSLTKARVDKQLNNRLRIIHQMLERYSLRQLIPNLPWSDPPTPEIVAQAKVIIALELMQRDDFEGAIRFAEKAISLSPLPRYTHILESIHKLKALKPKIDYVINDQAMTIVPKTTLGRPSFKITVGIITYNRAEWLKQAIESVVPQLVPSVEILVTDDGSTDNSENIVANFNNANIRYIRFAHRGAPATRNALVNSARGEFILWLDSDDLLLPKTIQIYLQAIDAHTEIDVHYGDWINVDENLKLVGPLRFPNWFEKRSEMIGSIIWNTVVPNGGTLIRRNLITRMHGYDETFLSCHDDEFWSRAAGIALFHHVGSSVYKRRQHTGSMTRGRSDKQKIYAPRIVKALCDLYPLELLTPEAKWGLINDDQSRSIAFHNIAQRLVNLGDQKGALSFLYKSQVAYPNRKVDELIRQIEATSESLLASNDIGINNPESLPEPGKHLEKPFFSIIIPTYNRARFIKNTIESALAQDYPTLEVVVVDDGSTDETLSILASFHDSRLHIVRCDHMGAAAARNRGIAEAKGSHIVWLDSDDELLRNVLNSYAFLLNHFPETGIAYGSLIVTDADLRIKSKIEYEDFAGRNNELPSKLIQGSPLPHGGSMINKSLYNQFGGYDLNFKRAHDYEWYSRVLPHVSLKYLNKPVYKWRWHDSNMSSGSVKIDLSFDIKIVESLVQKHPLQELVPNAGWTSDGASKKQCSAAAYLAIADRFLKLGGIRQGRSYLEKSLRLNPCDEVRELLRMVTGKPPTGKNGKSRSTIQLRVLQIVHNFPTRSMAGTELYTYHVSRNLIDQGIDASILYPVREPSRPAGEIRPQTIDNIPVFSINIPPIRRLNEAVHNPVIATEVSKWIGNNSFDLIHFQHLIGFTPGVVNKCRQLGVPMVLTLHDAHMMCEQSHLLFEGNTFCTQGPDSVERCTSCFTSRYPTLSPDNVNEAPAYISARMDGFREAYRLFDRVLVPTNFLIQKLYRFGFKNIGTTRWPFGMKLFQPEIHRPGKGKLRFLFLGNIAAVKGLPIAIEAFGKIDPEKARLDIYGKIYEPEILESNLNRVSDSHQVQYRGIYSPSDLPRILAGADVLVLPSHFEQYSTVAREALHAGVPVVASNVGGLSEIVQDNVNGLLFEVGNANDLTRKITSIIDSPDLLNTLGNGISPVRSIEDDVEKIVELYTRLTTESKQAKRA